MVDARAASEKNTGGECFLFALFWLFYIILGSRAYPVWVYRNDNVTFNKCRLLKLLIVLHKLVAIIRVIFNATPLFITFLLISLNVFFMLFILYYISFLQLFYIFSIPFFPLIYIHKALAPFFNLTLFVTAVSPLHMSLSLS